MVTVLYFAACRERAGLDREMLELDGQRVADAVAALVALHPRLADVVPLCRVALNAAFVGNDAVIPSGAELVLVPPVAGG